LFSFTSPNLGLIQAREVIPPPLLNSVPVSQKKTRLQFRGSDVRLATHRRQIANFPYKTSISKHVIVKEFYKTVLPEW